MVTTINQAAAYFKDLDSGTAITASAIRKGIAAGSIPHCKIGTRYTVDTDILRQYFAGTLEAEPVKSLSGIRRID